MNFFCFFFCCSFFFFFRGQRSIRRKVRCGQDCRYNSWCIGDLGVYCDHYNRNFALQKVILVLFLTVFTSDGCITHLFHDPLHSGEGQERGNLSAP